MVRQRLTATLLLALLGVAVGAAPRASGARAKRSLGAVLRADLTSGGPDSSATVLDLTTHAVVARLRGGALRPPASVEKLYTATTLLDRLGPQARLDTAVYYTGTLNSHGVLQGSLYLRGEGDPTFGSASFIATHYHGVGTPVSRVAAALVAAGLRRVKGMIYGDESAFDLCRGDPASGCAPDPYLEGTLSALAFNRGESGPFRSRHAPALYAARQLAVALRHLGVRVTLRVGAANTPAGARLLGAVPSPTVRQLLALMLPPSDNFFAEMLLKALAWRLRGRGTAADGVAVVKETVGRLTGLHPQLVDGSGLSRSDRTSTNQVVDLLGYLTTAPFGPSLLNALAVAGRSGTLETRMRHTFAEGRCRGKTGTLYAVSNLAGICRSRSGATYAFALFDDELPLETAHLLQDRVAETLAES